MPVVVSIGRLRARRQTHIDLQRSLGVQIGDGNIQNVQYHLAPGRAPLDIAADLLADNVRSIWHAEAVARQISTPAPVRVRWVWGAADVAASRTDLVTVVAAGIPPPPLPDAQPEAVLLESGTVTRLRDEVYARLPHGRLVLLGTPGAGKTGSMILLLLAASAQREALPEAERAGVPVPVWLTMGGWDPAEVSLAEWVRTVVTRDRYLPNTRYGRRTVSELLVAGRLALFLDGLDEMPAAARGRALERLDRESSRLRIVLTSRRDEYRQALDDGHLHNAAVIEIQPVEPDEAAAYLLRDQIGDEHLAWTAVGEHMQDHPEGVAAATLDNPLSLSLARSAYRHSDPAELTDPARFPTVDALRGHLLDRFLDNAYPDMQEREHARYWLSWIAHHMGGERDLAWWQIPEWVPRWRLLLGMATAATVAIWLPLLLLGSVLFSSPEQLWPSPLQYVGSVLLIGLVVGPALALGARWITGRVSAGSLGAIRPRLPRRNEVVRLIWVAAVAAAGIGLAVGLAASIGPLLWTVLNRAVVDGLVPGVIDGDEAGQAVETVLSLLLVLGLPAGCVFGLYEVWSVPVTGLGASGPGNLYRADRRVSTLLSLGAGVLVAGLGIAALFSGWVVTGVFIGILAGAVVAVIGRLVFGLASAVEIVERRLPPGRQRVHLGVCVVASVWMLSLLPAYINFDLAVFAALGALAAAVLLRLKRHRVEPGRPRFHQLLEDALARHVLRQAGSVYQFRHAELHDHLAWQYAAAQPRGFVLDNAFRRVRRRPARRMSTRQRGWTIATVTLLVIGLLVGPTLLRERPPDHLTLTEAPGDVIMFSPDGQQLAVSGPDSTQLWDLARRQLVHVFTGGLLLPHTPFELDLVDHSAAFSKDGHTLATSDGREVWWWDTATGDLVGSLPLAGQTVLIADPDTISVVTFDHSDDRVRLLDGGGTVRWTSGTTIPDAYAFAPDGSAIAVGAIGEVAVVDVATGQTRTVRIDGFGADVHGFAPDMWLSQDGRLLAVRGESVKLFDVETGIKLGDLPVSASNLGFSRDSRHVLVYTHLVMLSVWGLTTLTPVATLSYRHAEPPVDPAFGLDSSTVLSIHCQDELCSDHRYDVRSWDIRSGAELPVFPDLGWRLSGAAISSDGRMLATGWSDDRIRIWTLPNVR